MEEIPNIPFVRRLCSGLTEEEIKEAEKKMYYFCLRLKEAHEKTRLTDEQDEIS